jgi:uncharacterized protein involved in exopolysaccharide biosynthesis
VNQIVSTRERALDRTEHSVSLVSGFDEAQLGPERSVAHLRVLWENRRWLFRIAVVALLASTVICFLVPNRYESTARLMPPDNNESGGLAMAVAALAGNASSSLSGVASEMLGLKSTSEIFVGILSSRTVADEVIQQFDLKRLYHDRRMEDARKDLADHTSITVDRKSQIISIAVTDHDPKRAAAIDQKYVEELNRLVAELSTSSARRERIFLEGRLQDVSKDLESAEKDFSQFSSKNTAIDIKEQSRAMVDAAAMLQGQLIAAESELQGLRQIYADDNVRVRSVQARIAELERQLEKIGGKPENGSSPGNQRGDSTYPTIRQLPLLGVGYADLYRRIRVEEAVFESLTKEYEMAKVEEAKEIPTVKVLDAPEIPDKKSFPPRLLFVFLGTMFALLLAATWLFGKKSWEQTDAGDPRKLFAEEVFSTVKISLPKFANNGAQEGRPEAGLMRQTPRNDVDERAPE